MQAANLARTRTRPITNSAYFPAHVLTPRHFGFETIGFRAGILARSNSGRIFISLSGYICAIRRKDQARQPGGFRRCESTSANYFLMLFQRRIRTPTLSPPLLDFLAKEQLDRVKKSQDNLKSYSFLNPSSIRHHGSQVTVSSPLSSLSICFS